MSTKGVASLLHRPTRAPVSHRFLQRHLPLQPGRQRDWRLHGSHRSRSPARNPHMSRDSWSPLDMSHQSAAIAKRLKERPIMKQHEAIYGTCVLTHSRTLHSAPVSSKSISPLQGHGPYFLKQNQWSKLHRKNRSTCKEIKNQLPVLYPILSRDRNLKSMRFGRSWEIKERCLSGFGEPDHFIPFVAICLSMSLGFIMLSPSHSLSLFRTK